MNYVLRTSSIYRVDFFFVVRSLYKMRYKHDGYVINDVFRFNIKKTISVKSVKKWVLSMLSHRNRCCVLDKVVCLCETDPFISHECQNRFCLLFPSAFFLCAFSNSYHELATEVFLHNFLVFELFVIHSEYVSNKSVSQSVIVVKLTSHVNGNRFSYMLNYRWMWNSLIIGVRSFSNMANNDFNLTKWAHVRSYCDKMI